MTARGHEGGDNIPQKQVGDAAAQGAQEALHDELFKMPETQKVGDSTSINDNTNQSAESGMDAVNKITNGVTNSTAEKLGRMDNDPEAKKAAIDSLRDTVKFLGEQNQRQDVSPAAAASVSQAFEAGVAKSTKK